MMHKVIADDATRQPEASRLPEVLDVFRKVASEGLAAGEVMTIANEWSESDPLLACALYSAWLARDQTATAGAVWFNLGILLRNIGDLQRAEHAFRRALDAMPRLNHAHCALAMLLEQAGKFSEALRHCEEILGPITGFRIFDVAKSGDESAKNLHVMALNMFGRINEAKGRLGIAENAYEQSLILGGIQEDVKQRYLSLAAQRRKRRPSTVPEELKSSLACVHIDIVGGCQLKCVGCPEAINARKIIMIEPELLRKCLNNIDVDSIGMLRLFNFGEPLLHKKLLEVMNVVDEFRAGHVRVGRVEISTNAQGSNMPQFEQVLKNGSLDVVVVSCDGDGTREQYEEMRPPSKWTKLLRFLDAVANIKAQNNLDVFLQTRTVVQSKEDEERWNSVLLPRGWTPEFRSRYNLPGAPENRSGHALQMGAGICAHLKNPSLFVDADGTVVPCCAHPRAGVFGNLASHKFSEIAAGVPRTQFVEFMDKRRPEMNICNECEL